MGAGVDLDFWCWDSFPRINSGLPPGPKTQSQIGPVVNLRPYFRIQSAISVTVSAETWPALSYSLGFDFPSPVTNR